MPAALANIRLLKVTMSERTSDVNAYAPIAIGVLQPPLEPVLLLQVLASSQERGQPLGGMMLSSVSDPHNFEYFNFDWTYSTGTTAGQASTAYLRWIVELPDDHFFLSFVRPGEQPHNVGFLSRQRGWWKLTTTDTTVMRVVDLLPPERPTFRTIYVGGAPKSGTTWVEACLNTLPDILVTGENNFFAWPHQDDVAELAARCASAWGIFSVTAMRRPFANIEAMIGYGRSELTFRQLATLTGLEIIGDKTPRNAQRATAILGLHNDALLINCTRNPLDVAVSRFFHEAALLRTGIGDPIKGGRDRIAHFTLVAEYNEPPPKGLMFSDLNLFQQILHEWCEVHKEIHAARERWPSRVHTVRYEELSENPILAISRLLSFVRVPAGDDRVQSIVTATSFVKMSGGRQRGIADQTSFFRKGVIGDHSNYLSTAQIAFAIAYVKENAPAESWQEYF